jgi:hypothetical protein
MDRRKVEFDFDTYIYIWEFTYINTYECIYIYIYKYTWIYWYAYKHINMHTCIHRLMDRRKVEFDFDSIAVFGIKFPLPKGMYIY